MGRFTDLPNDIIWLILEEALSLEYYCVSASHKTSRIRSDSYSTYPDTIVVEYASITLELMAGHIARLSYICRRIRMLLRSRCRWNGNRQWSFDLSRPDIKDGVF